MEALVMLGVLSKLALLPGGLQVLGCAADAAGVGRWVRSMGYELYRTVERSIPNERPTSSAIEVEEEDVDAIEPLLSDSEKTSSAPWTVEVVGAAGDPVVGVMRNPCVVASPNHESKYPRW